MKQLPLWWITDGQCACPKGASCISPGKHPLTHNGVKNASDDPAQLQAWRTGYPEAHWAFATGNGIVGIDLDKKPGKDGVAALLTLAKAHGGLPRTATVRTGSGGLHLYFTHPTKVPNSNSKIAKGIDVRSDGGYLVAPPSGHVSGGVYAWQIQCPPAPLPAWLADLCGTHDQIPDSAPRETFPPATAELIGLARTALEAHGPAEQGDGGDMHTFQAAALLVNDFALTEAEAFPLLVEWNEACRPPWNVSDLRAKLRGGTKYGTRPYGCARPFDALSAAMAVVAEWRASGVGAVGIVPMMQKVRTITGRVSDVTLRALIEADVIGATGLNKKSLGLPPPAHVAVVTRPGEISLTTQLHDVADQAIAAIAPLVFQRNGLLCEVVTGQRTFIHDLETARIQDLMSQRSTYVRVDDKGTTSVAAPVSVATILQARRHHPPVRVIHSVTSSPIFLADGSILSARGYSAEAKVYLDPSVSVNVPESPTLADAQAGVALLADLVCDYQFSEPADRSVWLAGLLSPLVKAATGNAASPLFCVSASSPGAGKTLLTDVIARVVTGGPAEIRPYSIKDTNEWGKRLTAFVKAASPVSVFDNVNGAIGDEALDRLITSATWSDRLLGASEAPPMANVTVWFATGNNIEPINDTVRRSLVCRVVVDTEKPQERTNFKRPLLAEHATANRSELLTAALTILRAYHLAGRPAQGLPAWGSFTAWSDLVRGALVWAGCADPFITQQRASRDLNEPENDAHDFWLTVINASDGSPADIALKANQQGAQDVLGARDGLTAHSLRYFLGRFIDKPRGGKRIRREAARYWVETVR